MDCASNCVWSHSSRIFQNLARRFTTTAALKLYEKHGQCITTDISTNEAEATMSVLNTQTVNSTEAPFFRAAGTIYSTSAPGKFNVVFPPASWVDHTIVALGPLDGAGQYTYSIGTNHRKTDLFVLARDYSNWDETAVLLLIENYDLPPPVEIVQGQQCTYAKFLNKTD